MQRSVLVSAFKLSAAEILEIVAVSLFPHLTSLSDSPATHSKVYCSFYYFTITFNFPSCGSFLLQQKESIEPNSFNRAGVEF